jgi:hypothetical protein
MHSRRAGAADEPCAAEDHSQRLQVPLHRAVPQPAQIQGGPKLLAQGALHIACACQICIALHAGRPYAGGREQWSPWTMNPAGGGDIRQPGDHQRRQRAQVLCERAAGGAAEGHHQGRHRRRRHRHPGQGQGAVRALALMGSEQAAVCGFSWVQPHHCAGMAPNTTAVPALTAHCSAADREEQVRGAVQAGGVRNPVWQRHQQRGLHAGCG